ERPQKDPAAPALVVCDQHSRYKRKAIADSHRDHDVGCGEEHLVQIAALAVGAGIQEDEEEHAETEIIGDETNEPCAFALLHSVPEEERDQRDQQIDDGEIIDSAVE